MYKQSNPRNVDLSKPFIYVVEIHSSTEKFTYVGKATNRSRLKEYTTNVEKILNGKSRRPTIKRNGEPQSKSNLRYRFVHLALALAVKYGWEIKHYPYENVTKENLSNRENELIKAMECNLNNRKRWEINQFKELSTDFLTEFKLSM